MSAVPQGAFVTFKIKQVLESNRKGSCQCGDKEESTSKKYFFPDAITLEQPPLEYSSKLMNSIWGLYNQYSVHNLKKNKDSGDFAVF